MYQNQYVELNFDSMSISKFRGIYYILKILGQTLNFSISRKMTHIHCREKIESPAVFVKTSMHCIALFLLVWSFFPPLWGNNLNSTFSKTIFSSIFYNKSLFSPSRRVRNEEPVEGPYGLEVLICLVRWYHRQEINV